MKHFWRIGLVVAASPVAGEPPDSTRPPAPASTVSEAVIDVPDPQVTSLNQAIQKRIDAENARASAAQEHYAMERAAYEAALRKNSEEVATANARKAAWEAEMAARTSSPASGAPARAKVATGPDMPARPQEILVKADQTKRICYMEGETGSLVKKRRVCSTIRDADDQRAAAQGQLRAMTSGASGCGSASCP